MLSGFELYPRWVPLEKQLLAATALQLWLKRSRSSRLSSTQSGVHSLHMSAYIGFYHAFGRSLSDL